MLTRHKVFGSAIVLIALMALAVPQATAQLNPGRVSGTLVDEEGKPVGGITLVLMPEEQGAAQPTKVKVNKKGKFAVSFLPAGVWKVETQDKNLFLKSMHYRHKSPQGIQTDEWEATGHPTTGLRAFRVMIGAHAMIDLVLGSTGSREQLAKQIKLQSVSAELKGAVALYEKGDMRNVVTETTKILEKTPDLEQALYLRGSALWQLQRYSEAEADLRIAIAADPELSQIHALLGTALLEHARDLAGEGQEEQSQALYNEAAEMLTEERRRSPDDLVTLQNLIVALDATGRDAELEPALEALLEAEPDHEMFALRLADLYAAAERYDEALALIDELGLNDKGIGNILYNVAVAYYNNGETEPALEYANKVLQAAPDHVEVHRLMGYLKLSSGDREGALASLRKFVELAGADQTPAEQELIKELEKTGS